MTTPLQIPPHMLQDLIALQGEELGRVRKQLTDAFVSNEILKVELSSTREELEASRSQQVNHETVLRELAEAREYIKKLESERDAGVFDRPETTDPSNTLPENDTVDSDDTHLEYAGPSQLESTKIISVPDQLVPFCSTKQSPYNCVKAAKKAYKVSTSGRKWTVAFTAPPFVWRDKPDIGVIVSPCSRFNKEGNSRSPKKKGAPIQGTKLHVIAPGGGFWTYMGEYEASTSVYMTKEDFGLLNMQMQSAVIKATGEPSGDNSSQSMYLRGELLAQKIHLHRVGYDNAVQQSLLEAGGMSQSRR